MPELVIEIDTKADTENFTATMDYVYEKTQMIYWISV